MQDGRFGLNQVADLVKERCVAVAINGHMLSWLAKKMIARNMAKASAGEAEPSIDGVTPGLIVSGVAAGWPSERARAIWAAYAARGGYIREPLFHMGQALLTRRGFMSRVRLSL